MQKRTVEKATNTRYPVRREADGTVPRSEAIVAIGHGWRGRIAKFQEPGQIHADQHEIQVEGDSIAGCQ
jgi:hypothetical protein